MDSDDFKHPKAEGKNICYSSDDVHHTAQLEAYPTTSLQILILGAFRLGDGP